MGNCRNCYRFCTDTANIQQAAADTTVGLGSTVTGIENFNIVDTTLSNTSDTDVSITTYATAATWDATAMDTGEDVTINLTNATAAQTIKGGKVLMLLLVVQKLIPFMVMAVLILLMVVQDLIIFQVVLVMIVLLLQQKLSS